MKTLTKTSLLLLVSLLGACATPADDTSDGDIGEHAAPLVAAKPGVGGGLVGPVGPVGPIVIDPKTTYTARISTDDLNGALRLLLGGSRIVIETTSRSPTIPSEPFYHCSYPNQAIREQMQAECYEMAGSARARCLQAMNEEFPNVKECGWVTGPKHSYIDFGPLAEQYGAKDHTFDISPIVRDSTGPGSITVDINYVRTTVSHQTLDAAWTAEGGLPAASVTLKLESNSPTLPCRHSSSVLGCPDVELSNMKVNTKLTGIGPTADRKHLAFDYVVASFTFDRNLNNIPDWLVTAFVDIDKIIRNNVQKQVKDGLERSESRAALNKALTGLAEQSAKKNHPTWRGFKSFASTRFDQGSLVFEYEPL